jgi:hypothetical protein
VTEEKERERRQVKRFGCLDAMHEANDFFFLRVPQLHILQSDSSHIGSITLAVGSIRAT